MSMSYMWSDVHTDVDVTMTVSTPGVKNPGRQEHALAKTLRIDCSCIVSPAEAAALAALISDDAVDSGVAVA